MQWSTDVNGLLKNLDDLADTTNPRYGPLNQLLSPEFVSVYTGFADFGAMLDASGFKIETAEDFMAIPDDQWDEFIRSISSFPNWAEMQGEAGRFWVAKKIGF